jgi:hypothetical protein
MPKFIEFVTVHGKAVLINVNKIKQVAQDGDDQTVIRVNGVGPGVTVAHAYAYVRDLIDTATNRGVTA